MTKKKSPTEAPLIADHFDLENCPFVTELAPSLQQP